MKHHSLTFFLLLSVYCQAQFGTQQIISIESSSPRYIYTADIDGDKDMDVLSASEGDNTIAWYENTDGQGNFGPRQIISNVIQGSRGLYPIDLDGDDDKDVIATSGFGDKVVWYENLDGLGNFSSEILITNTTDGPLSVFAIDLDGDEDMDVLSASFMDNTIAWYENIDGLGNFGNQQIISNNALSARDVYATDLDGDGDIDVLSASAADDKVAWYENIDGLGNFSNEKVITINVNGVLSVYAADIDGDDDMDVLSASLSDDKVAWYENIDGLGNFGAEQIITNSFGAHNKVYAIDLDNDDDMDVLSSSPGNDVIAWYENTDGLGTFSSPQIISNDIVSPKGIHAADLDNDGDNDVLSVSSLDNKIAWYENLTLIGVNDFSIKIALYPNPVKTILIIENNIFHLNKVQMYDLLGRLVLEQINPNNQIDVSSLDSGLLFVKIETNKGTFMKKVLKE